MLRRLTVFLLAILLPLSAHAGRLRYGFYYTTEIGAGAVHNTAGSVNLYFSANHSSQPGTGYYQPAELQLQMRQDGSSVMFYGIPVIQHQQRIHRVDSESTEGDKEGKEDKEGTKADSQPKLSEAQAGILVGLVVIGLAVKVSRSSCTKDSSKLIDICLGF